MKYPYDMYIYIYTNEGPRAEPLGSNVWQQDDMFNLKNPFVFQCCNNRRRKTKFTRSWFVPSW